MKQNLFNKLWLRVGMIVAIMTTALAGTAWADTTETLTISSYATANGWTNQAQYLTATVGSITFTATGGGNTGKYYTTDNTWRFYANETAKLTISVPSGSTLVSVKPTFTIKDSGTLLYNNSTVTSASTVSVSGNSAEFTISQSSGNKGKIFFTEIEVTYSTGSSSAVATTTTIDATGITNKDVYVGTAAGSLSATVKDSNNEVISGATVTWSSSDTNVATINASGVVTLVAAGTTTITANYAGVTGQYIGSSATYTLNVTDSTPFSGVIFDATEDTGTSPITKDNVSFACSNGVLNNGSEYRMYKNSVTTISTTDGSLITKIEFTGVSGYPASEFGNQTGWTTSGYNGVWEGEAETVSFTASGAQVRATLIRVTVEANTNPSFTISNNNEIDYNSTSGSFDFTISNPVDGGTTTVSENVDWISNAAVSGNSVTFTTTANEATTSREGVITLTYAYGEETTTKDVTVTQAGNPNAVDHISDITAAGTYTVKGTIVAKSLRGFIVGDGTGYVYYYNASNFAESNYNIGDKVKLEGSVKVYGGVYEFDDETTITAATESNYVAENPTVLTGSQMDTRVASTTPAQLSTYVQYEGKFSVNVTQSGTHYNITDINGASTAIGSISYPLNATDLTGFDGKIVKVTGYYVGISSSTYYNTLIGSVEVVTTPVLSVTPAETNVGFEATSGTLDVEATNFDLSEAEFDVFQYFESDGSTSSEQPEWLTVSYNGTERKISYSVTANDGEARSAYFKLALAYGEEDIYSDIITINQAAYVAPASGKYVKVTSTDDLTDGQYLIVYEEGSVAFDGGLETLDAASNTIEVVLNNNEIAATSATTAAEFTIDVTAGTIQSASGKYIYASSYNNELKSSDEAPEQTNNFTIDGSGNAVISVLFNETQSVTLRYNKTSNQTRFRYYKTGQEAIQLYKKVEEVPTSQTVKVSSAGYATIVAAANLTIPAGVEVFAVTVNGAATSAHLEAITGGIPEGEAVLVKASEDTYEFPYATEAVAALTIDNDLKAATTAFNPSAANTIYCLAQKSGTVGFYPVATTVTIPAGKAYLETTSGEAPVKGFYGFDDDATAISSVESFTEDGAIYNLAGQRLQKMQKGINIVNGKKILK